MKKFVKKHSIEILGKFLEARKAQRVRLDGFVGSYMRSHKSIGPKEMTFISENVFDIVRNLELVKHLAGSRGQDAETLFTTYARRDLAEERRNASLAPQTRFSIHPELMARLESALGRRDAFAVAEISCQRPPLTVRADPGRASRSELMKKFVLEHHFSIKKTRLAEHGVSFLANPMVR